jgi:hypothetical protein
MDISIENPKKAPDNGMDKSSMPPLYSWSLKDCRVIHSGCRSQTLDAAIGVSAEYDLLVGLVYSILGWGELKA